jgi:hypothetical protein
VALKPTYSAEEKGAEIEEALDTLDKLVDRLRVLYEQYFMGIQKQAPAHLHTDAERRIREVSQLQIRNTALRYRFATIQQKYGSYNTYWKRTLREIEGGRYIRNLSKLQRQAMAKGETLPAEIMAAMPKRMRESIERDRSAALADAKRRNLVDAPTEGPDTLPDGPRIPTPEKPRAAPAAPAPRTKSLTTDPFARAGDDDIDGALSGLGDDSVETPKPAPPAPPPARTAPPPRPPPPPPRASPPSPPLPRAPSPTPARPAPVPGMTEGETRALYAKYVKAREVVGDKSDGFSYDKLVRTLQSQAPKILEQHKATSVEFHVVIRDNKVVLKAKPR